MELSYRFRTKPFEHQHKALKLSWNKKTYAYFMEMGTGKSKVLIDNICLLYLTKKIDGALIVAPKGVYRNWKVEQLPAHMSPLIEDYDVYDWNPNETIKEVRRRKDFMYQNLNKFKIFLMNVEAFSTVKGKKIADKFLQLFPAMFAIDESTTIKNPKAARTKAILKLGTLAKFRRILTGSPVTRSPLDLFSQCAFLNLDHLGQPSYWSYKNRYCVMETGYAADYTYQKVLGYQNIHELNNKLQNFSFRVRKQDCLDLPDKTFVTREVSMNSKQEDAYLQMQALQIARLDTGEETTAVAKLTMMMRLHQIACGFLTTDEGESVDLHDEKGMIPRLQSLLDCLDEIEGKVIIWATYRHNIERIVKAIRKKYESFAVVESFYGGTKDQDRTNIIERFKDPKSDLQYLVANPKTGGYGLNLTVADTIIYYSNNYDLEVRVQSEDRIHRLGQTNKCTYIDLQCAGTVDQHIISNLVSKTKISHKVLNEQYKDWIKELKKSYK